MPNNSALPEIWLPFSSALCSEVRRCQFRLLQSRAFALAFVLVFTLLQHKLKHTPLVVDFARFMRYGLPVMGCQMVVAALYVLFLYVTIGR